MISISWLIVCIIKGSPKNILWKDACVQVVQQLIYTGSSP